MMSVGNYDINMLIDGVMKVDGGVMYGPVPKMQWEEWQKADRRNRVLASVTALLIRSPEHNLLINAGVGGKTLKEMRADYGFTRSRLSAALKEVGLTARNVDIVALSNMRFYNSGGCTKLDSGSAPVPTFRNATYVMQEAALKAAKSPGYRFREAFQEADYGPLEEREMVKHVKDGDTIIPGVTVKVMDGVAKGNQVFYIHYGSERLMYVGDVIPTHYHLELDRIQADAEFPDKLIRDKQHLIKQALEEGWLMVFGRDPECPAAYLYMRNGHLQHRAREI